MSTVGILHPGEMGISVAASAIQSENNVYWASQGRSDKTRERAENWALTEVNSLSQLCQICEVIISICPPHAAEDVAQSVMDTGFKGLYLDANAISPQRSIRIGQRMKAAGIRFIDGGIIGGPAWRQNTTWLYLSGIDAKEIAACFSRGPLETKIIGDAIGKASALKMCYAAYSKGTTALLASILAASESLGIREHLYEHWDRNMEGFSDQANQRTTRVTAKAWRFEGEMIEIAATFREVGLPSGFHESAAEVYRRMADFKDFETVPQLHQVIEVLIQE